MQLSELLTECTYLLRDTSYTHWAQAELELYLNDALLEFVSEVRWPRKNVIIELVKNQAVYSKPTGTDGILEVTNAWFDGRPLKIVTSTEIERIVGRQLEGATINDIVTIFGNYSNPFGTSPASSDYSDNVQYLLLSHRSDDYVAVYPPPDEDDVLYTFDEDEDDDAITPYGQITGLDFTTRPLSPLFQSTNPALHTGESEFGIIISDSLNATDTPTVGMLAAIQFPKYLMLEGIIEPATMSLTTDTPEINKRYHMALVWGALARAYAKEDETIDLNKSNMYRQMFQESIAKAGNKEPINMIQYAGSKNSARFRNNRTNY